MLRNVVLGGLLAMGLGGCSLLPPPTSPAEQPSEPVPAPPAPEPADSTRAIQVTWLLAYHASLTEATTEALHQEHRRVHTMVQEAPSPRERIRLAILLSWPRTPFQDLAAAQEQLVQAAESPAASQPLRQLASLLHSTIEICRSCQQEQQALRTKIKGLRRQVQKAEQSNEVLREQLEAIKALERSLYERQRDTENQP